MASVSVCDSTSGDSPKPEKPKRIKKPVQLKAQCWICRAPAAEHVHYGAICCYSCRAFFRRSGHRTYGCINRSHNCDVNIKSRKQCKLCRYKRCLAVGMRPEMVDASLLAKREGEEMVVEEGSEVKQETSQSEDIDIKLGSDTYLKESFQFAGNPVERAPKLGSKEGAGHLETRPNPPVMGVREHPELCEMLSRPPGPVVERLGSSVDRSEVGEAWGGGSRGSAGTGMKCEGNQLWLEPGAELSNNRRISETLQTNEVEENIITIRGGSLETPTCGSIVDPLVLSGGPEEGVRSPLETEMEAGLLEALVQPSMALVQPSIACQGRPVETMNIENQDPVETGTGWSQRMELNNTSIRVAMANQVSVIQRTPEKQEDEARHFPKRQTTENRIFPERQKEQARHFSERKEEEARHFPERQEDKASHFLERQEEPAGHFIERQEEENRHFPASFTTCTVPFKKRDSSKEWAPYCQKLSLSLDPPSFALTVEEELFIDERVAATRKLLIVLHDTCHKYQDEKHAYRTAQGFDEEKEHCVITFREKAVEIFGKQRKPGCLSPIYSPDLIRRRFLCCAMAAVGVRLFGGPEVDCFPHNHEFYTKYNFLLSSPWSSSLEQEKKVETVLKEVGSMIRADKKMEVLFTSAIMRGFRDVEQEKEDPIPVEELQVPTSSGKKDMLNGMQFSLLLYRYLKNTRSQVIAEQLFQQLEAIIQPLYEATKIFYFERLREI